MAKNIAFRIKVEVVETDEEVSVDRHPQEDAEGVFSLVLADTDLLAISALDRAVLDTGYPAFREALSGHFAAVGKKNCSSKRNSTSLS